MKKILIIMLIILGFVPQVWSADCEKEYRVYCGKEMDSLRLDDSTQCLNRHINDFSASCQGDIKRLVLEVNNITGSCRKVYKKTCKWDINNPPPPTEKSSLKLFQCLMRHWEEYDYICQSYIRRSLPMLGDIDTALWEQQQTYKKMRVKGVRKKVIVEAQDGDIIWYQADLKPKKVVDQYEFCPELPEELGLEVFASTRRAVCYYKVLAPWGGGVIQELKSTGGFNKITDDGLWNRNKRIKTKFIDDVISKYDENCPDGFAIDIFRYLYDQTYDISCKRKEWFSCPTGYIQSYLEEGYFGCRKLSSCEESGEDYIDFGDDMQCAVCQAGGWVDQDQIKLFTEGTVVYCKVNVKNPEDESVCVEEIKEVYSKISDVTKEYHFKQCQSILIRQYDNQRRLMSESQGSHIRSRLLKGIFFGYYSDGTLKNEGERKNNIIIWEKKYNQKGQLTAEYRDGKWER